MSKIERAFITGSRAYGTPRDDSDIDLAIPLHEKDYRTLWALTEGKNKLQFGKLNIVAFNMDDEKDAIRFFAWRRTNYELCSKKPVTKEEACLAFREAGAESNYTESELTK